MEEREKMILIREKKFIKKGEWVPSAQQSALQPQACITRNYILDVNVLKSLQS